jgi:hypothetical protein
MGIHTLAQFVGISDIAKSAKEPGRNVVRKPGRRGVEEKRHIFHYLDKQTKKKKEYRHEQGMFKEVVSLNGGSLNGEARAGHDRVFSVLGFFAFVCEQKTKKQKIKNRKRVGVPQCLTAARQHT